MIPAVSISRRYVLSIILLMVSISVFGQRQRTQKATPRVGSTIVDDSTRNVYGPHTTKWTTEADLFKGKPMYRSYDTALQEYQRWTYVQRLHNFYQDLGVVGTALNEIFPTTPDQIGATSGFRSYNLYYGTQEPIYFDTKSPFSRFHLIWGGKGRAMTQVEFSRNINPRWNFGFNYRPILVEKQLQSTSNDDMMVTSHYYDIYTTYRSKNDRYFLLFNFRRIKHQVVESGGIDTSITPPSDFYGPNAKPLFSQTKTEEFRASFHLFHRFQLDTAFQLYHVADYIEEENKFGSKDDSTLFDANIDPTPIDPAKPDFASFKSMRQEVGVKGNLGKVFYSAYYKLRTYRYRNYHLDQFTLPVETTGNEQYLGVRAGFAIDSLIDFNGTAEYLFGGYHRLTAELNSPWLEASFRNSVSKPGFLQQVYRGAHDFWMKKFTGINMTQAKAMLKAGKVLKAGGTFTLLDHQVVFREVIPGADGQSVLPFQSSGNQAIFSPELSMNIRFLRDLYFRPQVIYTSKIRNDDNIIKIPLWFVNAQLAYERQAFKTRLQFQMGADFHWQSTYQALAYNTSTQSYYVQEALSVQAFPIVDVFFTGKMGRFRFFVKYNNLIQAFTGTGYQLTPMYPGQRSVLDLGFDFMLFD
jgi:hypothetical protein